MHHVHCCSMPQPATAPNGLKYTRTPFRFKNAAAAAASTSPTHKAFVSSISSGLASSGSEHQSARGMEAARSGCIRHQKHHRLLEQGSRRWSSHSGCVHNPYGGQAIMRDVCCGSTAYKTDDRCSSDHCSAGIHRQVSHHRFKYCPCL
jgi:hypothetical protein